VRRVRAAANQLAGKQAVNFVSLLYFPFVLSTVPLLSFLASFFLLTSFYHPSTLSFFSPFYTFLVPSFP
jgi:hypothetical protein